MMEQVIDRDGVTSLDFLTGNERYKQDWMSERRERCRLVFDRQTKAGPLPRLSRRLLGRFLSGWLKPR